MCPVHFSIASLGSLCLKGPPRMQLLQTDIVLYTNVNLTFKTNRLSSFASHPWSFLSNWGSTLFWEDSQFCIRDANVYFPFSVKPYGQICVNHCRRKTFLLFQEALKCFSPGLAIRIGYLWPQRCGAAQDARLCLAGVGAVWFISAGMWQSQWAWPGERCPLCWFASAQVSPGWVSIFFF